MKKFPLDNEYIIRIRVDDEHRSSRHNLYHFQGTIYWGDGSRTVYEEGSYNTPKTWPIHLYEEPGIYTVKVKGTMTGLKNKGRLFGEMLWVM